MTNKKEKIKGIVGTIIVHVLALAALIFLGLSTPLPLPGEEGVVVNFGYDDVGSGIEPETQQASTSPPEKAEEEIKQEEVVEEIIPEDTQEEPIVQEIEEEEIITQDTEEAPSLENPEETEELKDVPDEEKEKPKVEPDVKEKEPEIKEKEQETKQETENITEEPEEEKAEEPVVNPKALYKGSQSKEGTGESEGETEESGNQGSPLGDPTSDNYEGKGGEGKGFSVDLGGRGYRSVPKPPYDSDEQGKIVVQIWVDRNGRVTKALAGAKGSTIADAELKRRAEAAALRAQFNPDPNAPEIQTGTITYNFIKLK